MAYTLRIEPNGTAFAAEPGQSILGAADAALQVIPASCRNGTCRTCICHLLQGQAHCLIEWPGLSAEEKAAGCVLPCVYTATSDGVIKVGLPVEPAP